MTTEALAGLGLDEPGAELALLRRIVDTLTTGLDLRGIVQGVAAVITEATSSDVCFVHLLDDERGCLVLAGATPPFDAHAGRIELAVGGGVAGWVAAHQVPAVVADKFNDDRYTYLRELRGEEFRTLVSVPMLSGPDHLVGVLNAHAREVRQFSDQDLATLQGIANLMAGAVDNAWLHRRLGRREQAREQFAERLIAAPETERRRLAGAVHDGISQRIVGLSYHLTAAAEAIEADPAFADEQVAAARGLAAAALEETRITIAGLRPSVLDDLGLAAGLDSLARAVPGIEVEADLEDCRLADHIDTALYRIAQEALQNVVKHAQADRVRLTLAARPDGAVLEVADDGRGFADTARDGGSESYGLVGMTERADLIGARLRIESKVGDGTTIRVLVGTDDPPRARLGREPSGPGGHPPEGRQEGAASSMAGS
ncbi:GAF domain-containing sensor histidine kinase [soil metagenome]